MGVTVKSVRSAQNCVATPVVSCVVSVHTL